MTKTVRMSKKSDSLAERQAAMAAQDQIIQDTSSLVRHKFLVMSGKGGLARQPSLPTCLWPCQEKEQKSA
jgi:hypothetical protein